MIQGAQIQGIKSNYHSEPTEAGFLKAIQAEDQAIRNRGTAGSATLVKELSLFFGIQLLILAAVASYHFYI